MKIWRRAVLVAVRMAVRLVVKNIVVVDVTMLYSFEILCIGGRNV